jgi:hypothetical protein
MDPCDFCLVMGLWLALLNARLFAARALRHQLQKLSTRLLLKMILPSMILPIAFFDKTNRI